MSGSTREVKRDVGKAILCLGAAAAGWIVWASGCRTMMGPPMGEDGRLYRAKCSSCHQPVDPGALTPDEWRARLEHHGPKLTDAERAAILTYLAKQ